MSARKCDLGNDEEGGNVGQSDRNDDGVVDALVLAPTDCGIGDAHGLVPNPERGDEISLVGDGARRRMAAARIRNASGPRMHQVTK